MSGCKIHNIYLTSRDGGALAKFYREALGLTQRFADGDKWTQLSDGGANFAIAAPEEGVPGVSAPVVVFTAPDVAGLTDRIVSAGGEALGSRDMGAHGSVHSFRDPQGNVFQLFEPAARK